MSEITYRLVALVDDMEVYSDDFNTTSELQEIGLHRAEYIVERAIEKDEALYADD